MPTQRFSSKWALGLTVALLLGAAVVLVACGPSETPTPCPEVECPECPEVECPEVACPEPVVKDVPFEALWASSAHAEAEAEAFTHWNEDDPPEVPTSCAKCHSTPGYLDFLGVDGTAAGTVDNAAEVGTTITCIACHNEATARLDSVTFPSGVEVTGLGREARCMLCHQGRASTLSVDESIAEAGLTDDDIVSEDLGFTNIHYFAAAATQAGGTAMGGYQYEGKSYDSKFIHVEGFNTCVDCHDSHTLELRIAACSACHTDVADREDLKDIRMAGSLVDYDGDGDLAEGIYYEIEGLQALLYQAIQAYASEARIPIVYDAHAYPYFFIDTNANGEADEDEAAYANRYNAWTGRLAKAAYNYQTSLKDPGAFAHGGKYIIQLLYDAIEDLNTVLSDSIDLAAAHRIDHGHFAGSEEAFRHWDEEGVVPASCSKCHSVAGLPLLLKEGVTISQAPSNGLNCATCHDDVVTLTRHEVAQVEFPSGAVLDTGDPDSNLCLNCHQGRESTVSVNRAIAGLDADTVSEELGFRNVHYFAAGATRFGTEAKGAYEYEGKTYNGRFAHVEGYDTCLECHDTHALEPRVEDCGTCHTGVEDPEDIRMDTTDFDGDGDTTEGIAGEIDTLRQALYAAIQDYAANVAGTPTIYDAHAYPYFFIDTDGNGEVDPGEAIYPNRYNAWTPRLLQAAYNYQYSKKDPGAFAHNGKYVIQVLYDSLADIGDAAGMIRPESE